MCIRDRTYDASTTVSSSDLTIATGLIGSETLSLTGDVDTNSANVNTYSSSGGTINFGTTTIALADGTNGGVASNYAINNGVFTITQKVISLSGTRLYDATTNAVASDLTTISGRVGAETLTLSGTGTLSDANVAPNKAVGVGTLALGDGTGLAANYTLSGGTHQLTVNERPLNATIARQYDGTKTAAGSDLSSFDALQGGETLFLSGSGTVANKNVANGQGVTLGTLALDATGATGLVSNYSLNSAALNIVQRQISTVYLLSLIHI